MPAMPGRSDAGCILVAGGLGILVLAAGGLAYYSMTRVDGPGADPDPGAHPVAPAPVPAPAPRPADPPPPPVPAARPAPPPAPPAPPGPPAPLHPSRVATAAGVARALGAPGSAADPALPRDLAETLRRKAADPAYAGARRGSSVPGDPDRLPFEDEVKAARARVAAAARAPAGVAPLAVPAVPAGTVRVDGLLHPAEWSGSLEVPLDRGARLFVAHDGTRLLLAAEAPEDTTEKGYDQFRAYLHAGLAPSLVNERLHLSGGGGVNVLRETAIRWAGEPAAGKEESWKNHPLTDWNVQGRCEGASTMQGFRRYEAAFDLEEAGIPRAAPFPLFVEIEGDPVTENGKFKRRVMVGGLGAQDRPAWFVLE